MLYTRSTPPYIRTLAGGGFPKRSVCDNALCGCPAAAPAVMVAASCVSFMRTSYVFTVEFITKSWMAADALCLHPINSLAAQSFLLGVGPRAP